MAATPPMFCRVCQHMLNTHGDYDNDGMMINTRHEHAPWMEADHEAVPVVIEEYVGLLVACDFCLAEIRDGGWTFPCKDFKAMVEVTPGHVTDHFSSGDWAACDECYADIQQKRWTHMVARSKTYQEAPGHFQKQAKRFMRDLWREFETNRCGEPYHEQRRPSNEVLEALLDELKRRRNE